MHPWKEWLTMVETGDGPLEAELTTDEEHLLWT